MRWCGCKNLKELKKKELELQQKEKDLIEREKFLQEKAVELKKRTGKRAKKELEAAAKLTLARKKLLNALNKEDTIKRRGKQHKKDISKKNKLSKKNKNGQKRAPEDVIHNFFDKYLKIDTNLKKISKVNSKVFIDRFKQILQPFPCTTTAICNNCKCRPFSSQKERPSRLNSAAGDCYLMTLRNTPQLWIHQRWPQYYPQYLSCRAQWKNCGFMIMLLLGFLSWIPFLICLELCKCFICCCCTDC